LLSHIETRVVAIAFELSPDSIRNLSSIAVDQRVGLVSRYTEFVQIMINELESYTLNIKTPHIELFQNFDRIRDMLLEIDVLIFDAGCEKVLEILPKDLTAFELLHKPKLESVNRLRRLLSAMQ